MTRGAVPEADLERVVAAYNARATEYIEVVGKIEHAATEDHEYLLAWARRVEGLVLDVGCGPGQWSNLFREAGVHVEGIDPSETFIADAQGRYPQTQYRVGRAERLDVGDGSVGGVLAWFSVIHTDPDQLDPVLAEFHRAICAGGSLVLGFFEGDKIERFDHAVAPAWYWSVGALTERLERAGFSVVESRVRADPGARAQGRIRAAKADGASAAT